MHQGCHYLTWDFCGEDRAPLSQDSHHLTPCLPSNSCSPSYLVTLYPISLAGSLALSYHSWWDPSGPKLMKLIFLPVPSPLIVTPLSTEHSCSKDQIAKEDKEQTWKGREKLEAGSTVASVHSHPRGKLPTVSGRPHVKSVRHASYHWSLSRSALGSEEGFPLESFTDGFISSLAFYWGITAPPDGSDSKESAYNAGDPGSIPGSGRSPGEGNGNPLTPVFLRIPWTEEPGGLQSTGSQRVGHDWANNT